MQPLLERVAAISHRSSDAGQAIAVALEQAGARLVPVNDFEDAAIEHPSKLVDRAVATFGRLDIMVNTHVVTRGAPAESMPLSMFKDDVAQNLNAVFFGCQAAAQQMKKQSPSGGCIINISSVGGVLALPGQAAFCAAMAGVNGITQVLATEWQPYGVRVVSVGAGLTPDLVETLTLNPTLPDGQTRAHRRIPAHTLTMASEVAHLVAFLASDAAQHINGTTVYTDGGWLADGYWE